jgi:crotonobetainyl-CoA:carnitine CoA-transferase CaiB-like acyl-CoA transferase
VRLKDWVLTTDRFQERARKVKAGTLIDHVNDREIRERLNRIENRDKIPREIEKEGQFNDREEGITNAHVLMVMVNRIESVQRKVQLEYSRERKARIEEIKERLKRLIEKRHLVTEGSQEEEEVLIEIKNVNQELKEDVEKIDEAGRVRVRKL